MQRYDERERERNGQQVILEPMALLVAKPIKEKAVLQVNRHSGDLHGDGDTQGVSTVQKEPMPLL
jgi:hypothetical protein